MVTYADGSLTMAMAVAMTSLCKNEMDDMGVHFSIIIIIIIITIIGIIIIITIIGIIIIIITIIVIVIITSIIVIIINNNITITVVIIVIIDFQAEGLQLLIGVPLIKNCGLPG